MAINERLVDGKAIRLPFPASLAVAVGDLLFWDNTGKYAKPASSRTDLGSALLNQADFTALFIGIAQDQRLSTETAVTTVASAPTGPSDRTVSTEGIYDCDCVSATFEVGDLVGVARDGTNTVNFNQKVVGVTAENLAIGRVIQRVPTAATKVRCQLSANRFGWFKGVSRGLPPYKLSTGTTLTTFTAAQMTGAQFTVYTSTAATPGSIATATAAAMFAAIPGAFVGMQWIWRVINGVVTNSMTITADATVTLSGKTTYVATPFGFMDFLMTFTSPTALTMQFMGAGVGTTA